MLDRIRHIFGKEPLVGDAEANVAAVIFHLLIEEVVEGCEAVEALEYLDVIGFDSHALIGGEFDAGIGRALMMRSMESACG